MKTITSFSLVVALLALNVSCKKEQDNIITKTINVTLTPGQSYTTTVNQAGDEDDVLKMTQQASHAEVSEITPITGSKDVTFNYTPASQYTGNDQVQISTAEGDHQGKWRNHGKCSGKHHDETTVYVYNFAISGNNH